MDAGRSARAAAGLAVVAALSAAAGCREARRAAGNVTGPGWAPFGPLPPEPGLAHARAVLNRAAFGPAPGDLARVAAMGPAGYLEEQLAAERPESPAVTWRVGGLHVQQAIQDHPELLHDLSDGQLLRELQQAALLRAVYSPNQLRENLADLWTNHLNIYALKGEGRVLVPLDVERVVRPHAMGSFAEMLTASAHSPAMLAYLDNQANGKGIANENYARELLELHTLGVHSGYTQRDIQEVARCFTGWTVTGGWVRGRFAFDAARHDRGAKRVPFLGLTLAPDGGARDGEAVLSALAAHPATARHLAAKLCVRFLGHAPRPLVEASAKAYLRAGSDIRAALRPVLLDGLARPGVARPTLKRPLDLAVSALRCIGADTDGGAALQRHLDLMGQPLHQWPMPDGFPEGSAAWSGAMLPRWNFAMALAGGGIEGTRVDLEAAGRDVGADGLLEAVLGRHREEAGVRPLRERVRAHLAAAGALPPEAALAEAAGLLLASPQFQWR